MQAYLFIYQIQLPSNMHLNVCITQILFSLSTQVDNLPWSAWETGNIQFWWIGLVICILYSNTQLSHKLPANTHFKLRYRILEVWCLAKLVFIVQLIRNIDHLSWIFQYTSILITHFDTHRAALKHQKILHLNIYRFATQAF